MNNKLNINRTFLIGAVDTLLDLIDENSPFFIYGKNIAKGEMKYNKNIEIKEIYEMMKKEVKKGDLNW
ncbi:hypothetical protein NUSPORA_02273 [Nucleospora cyclopteri]